MTKIRLFSLSLRIILSCPWLYIYFLRFVSKKMTISKEFMVREEEDVGNVHKNIESRTKIKKI